MRPVWSLGLAGPVVLVVSAGQIESIGHSDGVLQLSEQRRYPVGAAPFSTQ